MDKADVKTKLTSIFRSVFSNDALEIDDATTADDVEGWDSLAHITLIVAVEKGFSIRLTTRDVKSLNNVGTLMELIEKKVA